MTEPRTPFPSAPVRRSGRDEELTPELLFRALAGAGYPAWPAELAECARRNHACGSVVRALETLPAAPLVGPDQVRMVLLHRHGHTQPNP
ncbi:DUF2795 domain-containing protein [Yinghuangia seranimata]|uniref:DUF2795 domain-containing protein n=1 Tax=Yinghuangia seranimata TaxID=408067 RepID=UPI00248BBA71|nr:DUF2795 domain-containing protein [Yinghuangia seranimata]MDI2130704.1 DUF2795 domain-containing protein [Yinghuangia seranimata]